jgi:hypothetical protein
MVKGLIEAFISTGKFSVQELLLTSKSIEEWVQFRTDPQRFTPKIFDGDWARPDRKPQVGPIKLVRVMEGSDGIHRLIGRQGNNIYATPWIG